MRTMIVTCSRDGVYAHGYLTGMLAAQQSAHWAGAAWSVLESDIARARNKLVEQALKIPEMEAVLFVDDDIEFTGADFEEMAQHADCGVLGGVYPKRKEGGTEVFVGPVRCERAEAPEICEVTAVGAGMMRIRRGVLEVMKEEWTADGNLGAEAKARGWHNWFESGMFGGRYLSEDYGFCWKARMSGFGVYLHRGVRCGHVGRKTYR
jgi:hypothetical protein